MTSNNQTSNRTIRERTYSADRALQLFQALRNDSRESFARSGCIVVSTAEGYELVLERDENALRRLSALLRDGGEAVALLNCSSDGEISIKKMENDRSLDDLLTAQIRQTFEAMHYARLLYPKLPTAEEASHFAQRNHAG